MSSLQPLASAAALRDGATALAPGILAAFTIAAAARFLSEHYGAPMMLFALLIGIAFHFLMEPGSRAAAGIEFTSRHLLRIGVALLGMRLTLTDVADLGAGTIAMVLGLVAVTIGAGVLLARVFGQGTQFGLLTGGAVAICGASAALAISSVLRPGPRLERDTLFTVVAVTLLSTAAMVAYPILFHLLGFEPHAAGALIGATVHDVAQVVGAGFSISEDAGTTATFVKLLRVTALPAVVLLIALQQRRGGGTSGSGAGHFPWFAVAFVGLLMLNSSGAVPAAVAEAVSLVSQWLLVAAIAALGVKTSVKAMTSLGPVYFAVILCETLVLLGLALVAWTVILP
jgi:uncharacterized integral membrane protein (TIGR00698 family)